MTDHRRAADEDNRKGYHELEAVKRTTQDASWLKQASGKAVKVVYMLLYDLPEDYRYRVLFMRRRLEEVLASQQAMLVRRGQPGAEQTPREMMDTFARQLEKVDRWLLGRPNFEVLNVEYHRVIADPLGEAGRINEFLDGSLDVPAMAAAVDPALYRRRHES